MRKITLKHADKRIILQRVGKEGPQGETGAGVPTGGNSGQHLAKASNTDFDTEWVEASSILSVNGQTGPAVILDKDDVGLGNVDNTSDANKPVSTATQTALDNKINTSEKGANNGVATLDPGGKVPTSQLPSSIMQYQGTWNAATNTPTLADGTGDAGDVYIVNVAGTQNLGSGNITFGVGDWVIYNGSIWQKADNSDAVASVFGRLGAITAEAGDYIAAQVSFDPEVFEDNSLGSPEDVQAAIDLLATLFIYYSGGIITQLDEKANKLVTFNTYTGTHIAALADVGPDLIVEMNVAGANNFTVPPESDIAWNIGDQINVVQMGAGQTSFLAGSGVTIRYTPGLKLRDQYSAATLVYRGSDVWYLYGDLTI